MQGSVKIRHSRNACNDVAATEGIALLVGAGIEALTSDPNKYFTKLWLYPAKAVVAGVLTANAAAIRVGKSGTGTATVTKVSALGSLVTVEAASHTFRNGQNVTIASATPSDYNGTYECFDCTAQGFRYRLPAAATTPTATGAITAAVTQYLPDSLGTTDGPMLIELPLGQKMWLGLIIMKGTATDGIFYSYT